MDRFDGNVWNLSDSTMASDSSNYHRVGDSITNNATGKRFTAKFTVDDGLSDYWLPMAGAASSVKFATSSDADSFYYNTDTMSAIYPSRTSPGLSYTETGVIPRTPTDKEIAKANASSISQPKAEDVPDCVDKLATAIAGGQSKGGEAAQALADKLRGIRLVLPWFEWRLPVQGRSRQLSHRPAARRQCDGRRQRAIRFRDGAYGPQSRLAEPRSAGLPAEERRGRDQ